MYTGYFSKTKDYIENGLIPISISRYNPKWFEGDSLKELAPSKTLLWNYKEKNISKEVYKMVYIEELKNANFDYSKIPNNAILLCYEKPSDFCHRHILAEEIRKTGLKCEEFRL